jgi:hypothetical protein
MDRPLRDLQKSSGGQSHGTAATRQSRHGRRRPSRKPTRWLVRAQGTSPNIWRDDPAEIHLRVRAVSVHPGRGAAGRDALVACSWRWRATRCPRDRRVPRGRAFDVGGGDLVGGRGPAGDKQLPQSRLPAHVGRRHLDLYELLSRRGSPGCGARYGPPLHNFPRNPGPPSAVCPAASLHAVPASIPRPRRDREVTPTDEAGMAPAFPAGPGVSTAVPLVGGSLSS